MPTLYAAGFNGHGQLKGGQGNDAASDLAQFRAVATGEAVGVLLARWGCTVMRQDKTVRLRGFLDGRPNRDFTVSPGAGIQMCFACDATQRIGFVSVDGDIDLLQDRELVRQGNGEGPKISSIAVTATGQACVAVLQAPPSQLIHLLQFKSFVAFQSWYNDPGGPTRDDDYTHYSVKGRLAQLEAGAAHFVLRTEAGDLYSWTTDARHHRCLGRSATGHSSTGTPALIEALGGVPVAKVAVGDWMSIALSQDRDAYVWGRERPNPEQRTLMVLPGSQEDVKLVDVAGGADITDVAAGSGHLLALTVEGNLFGVGENYNGQLSLGGCGQGNREYADDWTEITTLRGETVKMIEAGNCASFALADRS